MELALIGTQGKGARDEMKTGSPVGACAPVWSTGLFVLTLLHGAHGKGGTGTCYAGG